jgi:transcriptional regulator with XRE-family HTH domain
MRNHLSIDYSAIGQRLRAYRIGASLKAEDLAKHLGISRAAVYRLENGEIVKIEVLEKLSKLLNVSIASLFGTDVEYYPTASGFFERMRQLEEKSSRINAHFDPFSILLTSPDYNRLLETMLIESHAKDRLNAKEQAEIHQIISNLAERKKRHKDMSAQIQVCSLIGVQQIERFLHLGLVGKFNIQESKRIERVLSARKEILYLIEQIEEQDSLNQVAVVNTTLPHQTFEILYRQNEPFSLAISPFRLGEFPNVTSGIASVTSAPDAIHLYENMFAKLWDEGAKKGQAIDILRNILERY